MITKIMAVMGRDIEEVELVDPVICAGLPEGWLKLLEKQMQYTMRDIIRTASSECLTMKTEDFIDKTPS